MHITKITKSKSFRILNNFDWPTSLENFKRYNLIFGRNGAGKTTFSTLLRHFETRTAVPGDVRFEIDGKRVDGRDIPASTVPNVRVFNRDFVGVSFLAAGSQAKPIFILGADSVEKQKEATGLRLKIEEEEKKLAEEQARATRAVSALQESASEQAKLIREQLASANTPPAFVNYDRTKLLRSIKGFDDARAQAERRTDAQRQVLKQQKDTLRKDKLAPFVPAPSPIAEIRSTVMELVGREIISARLPELEENNTVSRWVETGIPLHTGVNHSNTCRFCSSTITTARRKSLSDHFNDAVSKLHQDIQATEQAIASATNRLASMRPADPSRLYDHLRAAYETHEKEYTERTGEELALLASYRLALQKKRENPFASIEASLPALDVHARRTAAEALDAIVNTHNSTTDEFQDSVKNACELLEHAYIADFYPRHQKGREEIDSAEAAATQLKKNISAHRSALNALELEIIEHRRPAEELNHDLHAYMGRDDLSLEVSETGYLLKRGNEPATNLSEGEKTAITFLYFLKSLEDKSFDKTNGIVVVDDPVSSLDSGALYSAFGFLRSRLTGVGQLFVLTHNFSFFRQVKRWLSQNDFKKESSFYGISVETLDGSRRASLGPIDPLLNKFETEYQYLFAQVYKKSKFLTTSTLDDQYSMPNIARRLLEGFLSFRYPGDTKLELKIEKAPFDKARKLRIERLLNVYSHKDSIADEGHDPSPLLETPTIFADVLALIESLDQDHYQSLESLALANA